MAVRIHGLQSDGLGAAISNCVAPLTTVGLRERVSRRGLSWGRGAPASAGAALWVNFAIIFDCRCAWALIGRLDILCQLSETT